MELSEETKQVVLTFPEPFKSAALSLDFNFDYKIKEGSPYNDHYLLKEWGYKIVTGGDCACYIEGENCWLNPTSWGDWGSVFLNEKDENTKAIDLFCKMYKTGIIKLWRIRKYIDGKCYDYDDAKKEWQTYDGEKWVKCDNPLNKTK